MQHAMYFASHCMDGDSELNSSESNVQTREAIHFGFYLVHEILDNLFDGVFLLVFFPQW